MLWSLLLKIVGGENLSGTDDSSFSNLATDSRLVSDPENELYFAIAGENHDGHNFIGELYNKGVIHFVIEKNIDLLKYPNAKFVRVISSVYALQEVSLYHRNCFNLPIIGITGSNGKTTIKEWLGIVLGEKYHLIKNQKSYNSQIGVPLAVWQINADHELGIFEAGISKPDEMKNLAPIIDPSLGIFTCIGPAHESGFKSLEQKIIEKSKLFEGCDFIICCHDHTNIHCYLSQKYHFKILSWSISNSDAYFFFKIIEGFYQIEYQNRQYKFKMPFSFSIWVENALHVICMALYLKCDQNEIQRGLDQLKPIGMRLEIKKGINGCYLIDDTYNNDLQGLSVGLDFQDRQKQLTKKTVILSDVLQSGMSSEKLYQEVSQLMNQHKITRVIGVGKAIQKHKSLFGTDFQSYETTTELLNAQIYFNNEIILVKGARNYKLEYIIDKLQEKNHQTLLEVNLESLTSNLNQYRKRISHHTKMMVMVKAFGYGGGSLEIANLLQYNNVDYIGVAFEDEAITLRENGITLPIMVMNPVLNNPTELVKYNIEPEIFNFYSLKKLIETKGELPEIHIKIDSGMHRLGFEEEQIDELISMLVTNSRIRIAGIFTHFSSAEDEKEDDFTRKQAISFKNIYQKISNAIGYKPLKHAVNSAGIIRFPEYHFDMVRLGIGLYGFDPTNQINPTFVSTLKTHISQIKNLKAGDSIGYSRSGRAKSEMKIATVPIGYADGYLRIFGNGKGAMTIKNQQVHTIGNICMDMTMIDITGLDVKEGDEVVLFGKNPPISQLARWAGTIPYEILTNIGQRVKRIYLSE